MPELRLELPSRIVPGVRSPFGHTFGGAPKHELAFEGQAIHLHLLFDLNPADPLLRLDLPHLGRLPLYFPFFYDGTELTYRVRTDRTLQVLSMGQTEVEPVYAGYPAAFPEVPVSVELVTYEAYRAVIFERHLAPGVLSSEDQVLVDRLDPPFTQIGGNYALFQDYPFGACENPMCGKHPGVFAVVPAEPVPGVSLWGEHGECVQIVFQVCSCGTVHTYNECD